MVIRHRFAPARRASISPRFATCSESVLWGSTSLGH
jgi:hypothetical protein